MTTIKKINLSGDSGYKSYHKLLIIIILMMVLFHMAHIIPKNNADIIFYYIVLIEIAGVAFEYLHV